MGSQRDSTCPGSALTRQVNYFRACRDTNLNASASSLPSWRPISRKFDMMLIEKGAHNNE